MDLSLFLMILIVSWLTSFICKFTVECFQSYIDRCRCMEYKKMIEHRFHVQRRKNVI